MASRRERILCALEAVIGGPGAPDWLSVHRNRRRPIERDQLPATVIYLVKETVELATHEDEGAARVSRTAVIRLEHRAIGEPDDQVLDPLLTWATRALMEDPSLGGLSLSIEETLIQWDGVVEDRPYAAAAQDFAVEYETPEDDPEG